MAGSTTNSPSESYEVVAVLRHNAICDEFDLSLPLRLATNEDQARFGMGWEREDTYRGGASSQRAGVGAATRANHKLAPLLDRVPSRTCAPSGTQGTCAQKIH